MINVQCLSYIYCLRVVIAMLNLNLFSVHANILYFIYFHWSTDQCKVVRNICLNDKNVVTLGEFFLARNQYFYSYVAYHYFYRCPSGSKYLHDLSIFNHYLFKMLCLSSTHPIVICTMYMYINLSMQECPLEFSRSCAHTNECLCIVLCQAPLGVYMYMNLETFGFAQNCFDSNLQSWSLFCLINMYLFLIGHFLACAVSFTYV